MEQPAVVPVVETAKENPAQDKAGARIPTRGDETAETPPPSCDVEEGDKVPTPLLLKKRGPQLQSRRRRPRRRAPLAKVRVQLYTLPWLGVAGRVRSPKRPLMTKWWRSRGIPTMVANTFTCGASVGTTGLATRSSPRLRRRRE